MQDLTLYSDPIFVPIFVLVPILLSNSQITQHCRKPMTKSSKARKAKARAKKRIDREAGSAVVENKLPEFTQTDKRYLIAFAILSAVITVFYWSLGGRNLLVFPALLCISVGARKYWKGPVRRFADQD